MLHPCSAQNTEGVLVHPWQKKKNVFKVALSPHMTSYLTQPYSGLLNSPTVL